MGWCESVLTALPPATAVNSVFPLPLFQVISISGLPRRAIPAYNCKFLELEP